jgi:hypothetical protein
MAAENPYSFPETRYQQQFSIDVWTGISGHVRLGLYALPPRLSGASFLQFLSEQLPQVFYDATLHAICILYDVSMDHSSGDVMW